MPYFGPKSWFFGPKIGFLAILTPKSALCPKFLLAHWFIGCNLHRIWWGTFWSRKKALQNDLKIAILTLNSGFEANLALQTNYSTQFAPKMPQYDDWPCCGPPLVPLQGTCVVKYDHNDNFSEPNLSKLASTEPNCRRSWFHVQNWIFPPNNSSPDRKHVCWV